MKHCTGKRAVMMGVLVLALAGNSSAYAQMGGGMMGGFGSGGGMMGGFGPGGGMTGGAGSWGGNGPGMRGGYGPGAGNGDGPGYYGDQREAPPAPKRDAASARAGRELGPLDQLDLSRQQRAAIDVINGELRDRQSNLDRRLALEQEKLRALYDAPVRDQAKIDGQFRSIDQLRRERFESTADARDRIEAQLNVEQRQRLHRIAPRWSAGG